MSIAQAGRLWPDQDAARLGLPVRQRARAGTWNSATQAGQVMRLGERWSVTVYGEGWPGKFLAAVQAQSAWVVCKQLVPRA